MRIQQSLIRNLSSIILVAVLAVIVAYNYFGEYCAHCDGYGWDGSVYYKDIVLNGWNQYTSGNISQYHTHRMLPFLITHYVMKAFSLPFSPAEVMLVSSIINTTLLFIAVCFFFGISRTMGWNRKTEALIFSFAFFNFHVLKFMGYCPVMTDMPAFTLSMALAFFFIRKNKPGLVITGLTSILVFPLLSLMALLLVCLPGKAVGEYTAAPTAVKGSSNKILNAMLRAAIILWLPLAFGAYIFFRLYVRGVDDFRSVFIARYPQSEWISVAGIAAYIIFYFFATKPLRADITSMLRQLCSRRRIISLVLWLAGFYVIYTLPTVCGFKGKFSLVNEFAQICQFPATDILIFIETHFIYLGLGFLFLILFWPQICHEARRYGMGAWLIAVLSLIFLSDIETRKIICFYIFLLPLMGTALDKTSLKIYDIILILILQLAFSAFYYTINTAGITEAFATYDIDTYLQMPSQRYYMFQGPWQSHDIYLQFLWIEAVLFFTLYNIKEKGSRQ